MDYTNDCILAKDRAMAAAQEELRLFCQICGMPVSAERNYLIGGDPHGVAEINDTYWLNMSDVHVVVSEYERWLKLYETNEGIAKAVREWYYWSLDWHQKHPRMEWIDARKAKPEAHEVVIIRTDAGFMVGGFWDGHYTWLSCVDFKGVVTHWCPDVTPDDTYCPNLRAWLSGCPVPGLREATEEYKRRTEKELTAAHLRVEAAQEELRKAIAAEKEFGY